MDHTDEDTLAPRSKESVGAPATPAASGLPRRIAIVTAGELFGGVERHILGFLPELRTRNVEPTLVLFHDGELAQQARELNFLPVVLPSRNALVVRAARQLAGLLRSQDISLVHLHGYKATVSCLLALKWHAFAIVKTEHGLPELNTGRRTTAVRATLYHKLDRVATRLAGATICYVSEELREHSRHAYAALPSAVIPNGISPIERDSLRRPQEFGADCFNLVVVGRLEIVKGISTAVRSMAASEISKNVHLYIIGTGPDEAALRSLAQELSLTNRVHFLGFRRNVYSFIAHADALVMPSLHEGLPYTLLEAMSLATPIIASRVGGLAEVLQDEITALLVPPGDPAALARAISRLRDHAELGLRLASQAQHVQRENYSVDAMTRRYLDIYITLAGGST